MRSAIIIFVRQPALGKVKTRLASTIGDEKALRIYKFLLNHTYELIKNMPSSVYIYYAGSVADNDLWQGNDIIKKTQSNGNLGEKMAHAFREVFEDGFSTVVIIGSDCYELTTEILDEALQTLENKEIVIGPAKDGGYYLLGMRFPFKDVFEGIAWSTDTVFTETFRQVQANDYSVHILPVLTDVDTEKDINFSY